MDTPSTTSVDVTLDLGEAGCGQLVMEIMFAMRDLAPGQTLLVTAYDPAAPADIAAWCRMTGNELLAEQEGELRNRYFLRKA